MQNSLKLFYKQNQINVQRRLASSLNKQKNISSRTNLMLQTHRKQHIHNFANKKLINHAVINYDVHTSTTKCLTKSYSTNTDYPNWNKDSKKVLLFGSGFVSRMVVDHLLSSNDNFFLEIITRGSIDKLKKSYSSDAKLNSFMSQNKLKFSNFELGLIKSSDKEESDRVYSECFENKNVDIVVSLLPRHFNHILAECCLKKQVDFVNASYITPQLKNLDEEIKNKGLVFLSECGLDPGLDHMSAIKIIKEMPEVNSFRSFCGGLPDPRTLASNYNNILNYKCTWSPRGVLDAAMNDAIYLHNNQKCKLTGGIELLKSRKNLFSEEFENIPGFENYLNLEYIANRDSLSYIPEYGLKTDKLKNMFRSTLRFIGFLEIMQQFIELGFLDLNEFNEKDLNFIDNKVSNFFELILNRADLKYKGLLQNSTENRHFSGQNKKFLKFLENMGLFDSGVQFIRTPRDPRSALAEVFLKKFSLKDGECDLVLMKHIVESQTNIIQSELVLYGDQKYSAMQKTVGIPVAVAVELLLLNKVKKTDEQGLGLGVVSTAHPNLSDPILKSCCEFGIAFHETNIVKQNKFVMN